MSRTKSARRGLSLWLLCGAIAGSSACDDAGNGEPRENTPSVLELSQALQGAVASCAETARACRADAGEAEGADATCATQFDSCRDAAREAARPALEGAVNACAEQAKSCREAAGDAGTDTCKEQLKACVGEAKVDTDGGSEDQGKPDGGGSSPVAACHSALRSCLEGDAQARVCTGALQDCIAMTVGHNGTPPDHDGGKPDNDAGKPDHDGGKPDNDAGKPEHDGGKPDDRDAGKPERDAAEPTLPDAAMGGNGNGMRGDAGMSGSKPPEDAGTPDSAKECKEAREQCLASGQDSEACARMQRACRDR